MLNNIVKNLVVNLNHNFELCLARGRLEKIYEKGSDVDLIVPRQDIKEIQSFLLNYCKNNNLIIVNIVRRSYVHSYYILEKSSRVVFQIDFEFNFDWWSLIVIESQEILSRRVYMPHMKLYAASEADSNIMKMYRSLLWGGFLKKKYINNPEFYIDVEHLCKFTNIPIKSYHSNPIKYIQKNIKTYPIIVKEYLRKKNIEKYGFFSVFIDFFNFLISEFLLFFDNNGLVISIELNDAEYSDKIKNLLNSTILEYGYYSDVATYSGFLSLRKMLRDNAIVIVNHSSLIKYIMRINYKITGDSNNIIKIKSFQGKDFKSKKLDFAIDEVIKESIDVKSKKLCKKLSGS